MALAQLARLSRPAARHGPNGCAEDVPVLGSLIGMIESAVGALVERPNGALEGPCPWHDSGSGRCLVVFDGGIRWWCRSCKRGGDRVAWLALSEGISFAQARGRLGLPPTLRRARRRPVLRREVSP